MKARSEEKEVSNKMGERNFDMV